MGRGGTGRERGIPGKSQVTTLENHRPQEDDWEKDRRMRAKGV